MASVAHSWAVLFGRRTGDSKRAKEFLEEISPGRRIMQNRSEAKARGKAKSKALRLGQRPRKIRITY